MNAGQKFWWWQGIKSSWLYCRLVLQCVWLVPGEIFLGPTLFELYVGYIQKVKKCVCMCVFACVCVYVWESSYKVGCRDELCYSEHNITRWPTSLEQSTHMLMYTQLPLLYRRTSPSTQKPLEKHWTPHQWGHAKQRPWQIMNQISPKSETN